MSEHETRTPAELLEPGDTVTFTTPDGRGRPMTINEVDGGRVWFLTSRSSAWVAALTDGTTVGIHVNDGDDGLWASLVGSVSRVDDRQRLDELWTPIAHAWFDGSDDPDLTSLVVDVADGEWWDSSSSRVARLVRIGAAMVGDDVETGDRGDVAS